MSYIHFFKNKVFTTETEIAHITYFWPQIVIEFMCYICNMGNENICCKNLWFSVSALFAMRCPSCVICAFEINEWFIIII